MNPIAFVMACFSVLGGLDLIIGNKFGLGAQFKRGLELIGVMALSMVGMIVMAPLIGELISPALSAIASVIPFEPSVVAGSLLANDMGGAPLSQSLALTEEAGYFNGLVVSSMMGATISFSLPFSLGVVPKEKHEPMLLGLLCGVVTVPVGCLVGGLVAGLEFVPLMTSIVPLTLFSAVLAVGLLKAPKLCVKIFKVFAVFINTVILVGLIAGIFESLTGIDVLPHLATVESGYDVCVNASMVMSGAFPLVYIISKLLDKPMKKLGEKIGVNTTSAVGFLSTLATNVTTFGNMKDMDEKGTVLNSAFAVSAAFVFAGHLAFTLSFNADYIAPVIIGKLVAGITSVFVAVFIYGRTKKNAPAPVVAVEETQNMAE